MVDGEVNSEERDQRISQYTADNNRYVGLIVAIEDDVTDSSWAEFFSEVHGERKKREDWFDSLKEPLNKALKILNTKQHEVCDPLKEVEDAITKARGNWYYIKQQRQEEENKKAIRDASGDGGVAIVQPKPTQTVVTSTGAAVGLRKQPSWRFTDDPTITARAVADKKMQFTRAEPRLKNVPDAAFYLQASAITALLKTGAMPEGEHSIEKFDEMVSTQR